MAFVGQDAFLKGLRTYFAEHAFGNTELGDLLRALERASGRNLSHWSGEWLETAGVNTLVGRFQHRRRRPIPLLPDRADGGPRLIQYCAVTESRSGSTLVLETPCSAIQRVEADIAGASTAIPELDGTPQPDLLLPNDDDLSYCKVRLDRRSLADCR